MAFQFNSNHFDSSFLAQFKKWASGKRIRGKFMEHFFGLIKLYTLRFVFADAINVNYLITGMKMIALCHSPPQYWQKICTGK